jgi:hypothetical protein
MAAMNTTISTISTIQGGASVNPFEVIYNYMDRPVNIIFGFLLIVLIVFANQVPIDAAQFINSATGRVIALSTIFSITAGVGWVYGLLSAIAFLLIINIAPNSPEGFSNVIAKDVERPNNRWFVERVLGERTVRIETDKVDTGAVQDLSNRSMS